MNDQEHDQIQDGTAEERPRSLLARAGTFVGELLHVVIISLAIILPVRYFLIQPFYVKGASMEPNFYDSEYLIIDELSYRIGTPVRGDIVVFRYPRDPSQYFIKRVIGVPGDRVVVGGNKVTIYDAAHPGGFVLDETSYLGNMPTGGSTDVTLGQKEFYLLGDNRGASLDSRSFGPVQESFLIGRVWIRGWPPEKAKIFTSQTELIGEPRQ